MPVLLQPRWYGYSFLAIVGMVPVMILLMFGGLGSFSGTGEMLYKFLLPLALSPVLVACVPARTIRPWKSVDALKRYVESLFNLTFVGFIGFTVIGMAVMVAGHNLNVRRLEGIGLLISMLSFVFATVMILLMFLLLGAGIGGGGIRAAKIYYLRIKSSFRIRPDVVTE